ncbi:MAG: sugar ABC transporter ATP-binding protein [Oscillospiraceae bacterium]|nr:sugar ABC transporter ATP-binding protein [Oscillospiraceae bacterium]
MNEDKLIIETRQLCKNFGPTVALNHVDMKFYRGQITGLIGENGSGKSTITSIVAGMQPATSGEMFYQGKPHKPSTMLEGSKLGIGMIVQEQGYVSGITIAQNIFLGKEGQFRRKGVISRKEMIKAAQKALDDIGCPDIDASWYIDRLNIQDRKLVELARVMAADPEVLVVDETTTALSQRGRDIIYGIMRQMRDADKCVIFISHDLEELMEICDRMVVLRDGNLITSLDREEFDADTIKKHMVGRDIGAKYYRNDWDCALSNEIVLDVKDVTSGSGLLMNFSMQVHKGEILGIGGLSHCGMHELGKVIFGEEKLLTGTVTHVPSGEQITNARQAMRLGLGYVSKDRDKEALVLAASIKDNIASAALDKINQGPFILPAAENAYVNKQVKSLSIKCASINQNVQYLSGGNKQKVVFGKWIGRDGDILILDCPTRGVDNGVKAAMYQLIEDMKAAGKTIIMISEELAELIGMSDRLLILKDGALAGEFMRSPELTDHQIIDCMI